jgi:4-amino-4-deoxy-L-arabinose transferase-like glycosyltransferase
VWAWVVIVAAVIGGVAIRFVQLGTMSLWFDEGYTAWVVSQPVGEIVRIIKVDTAPPLYYILLRGWTSLFGFSEAAMRSMSALMSGIGLVVFVAIARRMFKSPWAVAAAVTLFSFSFMQISYAHEARFYAMMTMLEAIDLYLVLLVCERSGAFRLACLAAAWIASLYANNMMVVYLGCLGIAWLLLPGARPMPGRLRDAAVVTIISAVAFAPWLPALLAQTKRIQGGFWPDKPDALSLERTIAVMAGVHDQSLPTLHWKWHTLLDVSFLHVNLALLGLALIACTTQVRLRQVLGIMVAGLGPILLIYFYSRVRQSIFMERAFLASGVAIPLLVVFALDAVRSRPARVLSIAGVVAFLAMSFGSIADRRLGEHPENWRDACAFARKSPAKHRLVVCDTNDGEPLYRYYACARDYGPRADVTAVPTSFFSLDPPRTMQRVNGDRDLDSLRAMLAGGGFDEVDLIASHTWWGDQSELAFGLMRRKMAMIDQRQFTGIIVFRFNPRARPPL